MGGRVALVTGGTSGVGRSLVPVLVEQGFHVHFIGRDPTRGHGLADELNAASPSEPVCTFVQLDLSELRGVRDFAERFATEAPRLDLLLNVAGVLLPSRQVTSEGFEKTLAIGYLSAFVLCRALAPALAAAAAASGSARIANVAGSPSQVTKPQLDFDDLGLAEGYSGVRAAVRTVHAKTVLTAILAEQLRSKAVDVNAFHPGMVRGSLGRNLPMPLNMLFRLGAPLMARTSKSGIHVSTEPSLQGTTGQLFVGTRPRPLSFDAAYQDRLWSCTTALVDDVLGAS